MIRALALLSLPALAACATMELSRVTRRLAQIQLTSITMDEPDPLVRSRCEQAIVAALRTHGFVLGARGPRMEVRADFGYEAGGFSSDAAAVADLTATMQRPGRNDRPWRVTVSAVGEVGQTEAASDLLSTATRARRYACEGAAERLAIALVESLGPAPATSTVP